MKKQVLIPPSRRIEVELPADTPEGLAEVVVLVPAAGVGQPTPPTLVFEDIDEQAWDDAQTAITAARRSDRLRRDDST